MASEQPVEGAAAPDEKQRGFRAWLKHAFAVEPYDESSLAEPEKQAIAGLAARIEQRGLATAAILWVQSNRHFNWMGSQAMVFLQPFFDMTHPVLNGVLRNFGLAIPPAEFPVLASAFEKRYSVEYFLQQLESFAAASAAASAAGGPDQSDAG